MDTWGEKDLCLFWEWAQEYFGRSVSIRLSKQFLKKNSLGFIMVCHIGGQLGTKVVILALGMLALYMRFNGTGIWGGETILCWVVI